jgi:hypothetical protein
VILLAGSPVASHALERHTPVVDVNADILALEPWELGGNHVVVRGLVNIDRRHPATWTRRHAAALDGEEIAERIPARKRHGIDASTW